MGSLPPSEVVRVLVVDDDDEMRTLLVDYLGASGFAVTAALDVRDGLERSRRQRPHVIVADLSEPAQASLLVPSLEAVAAGTPKLIVIRGLEESRTLAQSAWATASAVLDKPFRMEDLVRTIRMVLPA